MHYRHHVSKRTPWFNQGRCAATCCTVGFGAVFYKKSLPKKLPLRSFLGPVADGAAYRQMSKLCQALI